MSAARGITPELVAWARSEGIAGPVPVLKIGTWVLAQIRERGLTRAEAHVIKSVVIHLNADVGAAWPSLPLLQAECVLKRSSVENAINGLTKKGLLWTVQRGKPAYRVLLWPELYPSSQPDGLTPAARPIQPTGPSPVQPTGPAPVQPTGPRTTKENSKVELNGGGGARAKDDGHFDSILDGHENIAAWGSEHFPGSNVLLVSYGLLDAEDAGAAPTINTVRPFVERRIASGDDTPPQMATA